MATKSAGQSDVWDVVIIGGGPAGLTAGLYCSRNRLNTLLVERAVWGGQIATTTEVENFPGFVDGILGPELGEKILAQAQRFGLNTRQGNVTAISDGGAIKHVTLDDSTLAARALILATGSSPVKLNVPGEKDLTGHGVSYCATCDGPFFRDKSIAVVGGGNSAVEEGMFLTRFARKVTIIHRRDALRADRILQERAFANPKIAFLWDTVVERILGAEKVTGVAVRNVKTDERRQLPFDGVFVMIGQQPNTEFLKGIVELDERGYIRTNERKETSLPGIFAAGDVQDYIFRQAITAAGDGAAAAISAARFLEGQHA